MKKFLSLALALVMSLSLLTVASAAEYKDLTDKNEITYSEAVAVLNKLGIISGYEDGSFKPETALNRAQAAKIICGLLLGQKTADNLTVSSAPYKDVAADYWAAAYISYCKTAGIIDGYSDGTFKPTATLTGYQFGKMLLTALGYDSETEGFIGRGWTLNVAKVANIVGLFDGNIEFSGAAQVTREEACLYALNMLKADEVTYDGLSINVSAGDSQVSIDNTKAYKVGNDGSSDGNIKKDGVMQFAEEHFGALKITSTTASDDYGRPANSWSYKNVTFGTFAKQPDFVFTAKTGKASNTETENAKALGLKGYTFDTHMALDNTSNKYVETAGILPVTNGVAGAAINSMSALSALTGNGVKVEVYVSEDTADLITDVVIVKTELAQISKINTVGKVVTLKTVGGYAAGSSSDVTGTTLTVKDDNDNYEALTKMAKDDYVLVTLLKGAVDAIAVPTVETGKLSKVTLSSGKPSAVTVNGTAYDLAAGFSSKTQLTTASVSDKNDSTAFVDAYGYVIYMKDVTASTNYILVGDIYTGIIDGRAVNMVAGYAPDGTAVTLNVGTQDLSNFPVKSLVSYTNDSTKVASFGEYALEPNAKVVTISNSIAAGNLKATTSAGDKYFASDVNFIYVTMADNNATIKSVTVKDGVQKVTLASGETMKAILNSDGYISTVVVYNDADVATGTDVVYVQKIEGTTTVNGKVANIYTIWENGVKVEGVVSKNNTDFSGKFATYAVEDGIYTFATYTKSTNATSVATADITKIEDSRILTVSNVKDMTASAGAISVTELNAANAEVINLVDGLTINSVSDLADAMGTTKTASVKLVFNNDANASAKGTVAYIIVTAVA